jgi:hypothetical protein
MEHQADLGLDLRLARKIETEGYRRSTRSADSLFIGGSRRSKGPFGSLGSELLL